MNTHIVRRSFKILAQTLNGPQKGYRILNLIERVAALGQGKGFGTSTINREVELALRILGKTPSLVIDIGGNIGNYTAELRRQNPQLEIHIFEPSATNIEKLISRFEEDDLIKIVPKAITNFTGAATLHSDILGSGLGSLSKRNLGHLNIEFEESEPISTMRFEDYWKSNLGSRSIDIAKLDIEGHELTALESFGAAIEVTRVVQFEFGGCNIATRTYFHDFWKYFTEHGFAIFRITPFGAERIFQYREHCDESILLANFIAVRT